MTAQEYRSKHEELMAKWESEARSWLLNTRNDDLAQNIPFFRDGVTCPEVWFEDNNSFRPLFILKEVSTGKNKIDEVQDFLSIWGNKRTFEFAQYEFDDIKVGTFSQWKRIARLAKAFETVHNGTFPCDYSKYDMSFWDNGKLYSGNILGYKDPEGKNSKRTANPTYNDIINKIAILELKKVGAGQTVTSELSLATEYYTNHIEKFKSNLSEQIKLINPTVIIGLGRENGKCITELLKDNNINVDNYIVIEGYHHTRSSNANFYDAPLLKYMEALKNKEN